MAHLNVQYLCPNCHTPFAEKLDAWGCCGVTLENWVCEECYGFRETKEGAEQCERNDLDKQAERRQMEESAMCR